MSRASERDTHAGLVQNSGFAQINTKALHPSRLRRGGWVARKIKQVREFASTYALYHKHHGRIYSARIAFGISFAGLPF